MNIYWLKFNALFVIYKSTNTRCQLDICQLFIERLFIRLNSFFFHFDY